MMQKVLLKVLYILTAVVTVLNVAFGIYGSLFFKINDLPDGKLSYSVKSPDGVNAVNMYVVKNNLGKAVRCEFSSDKGQRNFFWQTDTERVIIFWLDNATVSVDGMLFNVKSSVYDCRRGRSLFQEGAIGGDTAADLAPRIANNNQH